jgi:hypothetical protein
MSCALACLTVIATTFTESQNAFPLLKWAWIAPVQELRELSGGRCHAMPRPALKYIHAMRKYTTGGMGMQHRKSPRTANWVPHQAMGNFRRLTGRGATPS